MKSESTTKPVKAAKKKAAAPKPKSPVKETTRTKKTAEPTPPTPTPEPAVDETPRQQLQSPKKALKEQVRSGGISATAAIKLLCDEAKANKDLQGFLSSDTYRWLERRAQKEATSQHN